MGTAIKHPVLDWVKKSFVIFDIRALWRSVLSVRVPGCQKLQMTYGLTRSGTGCFNYSCARVATVGVKGFITVCCLRAQRLPPAADEGPVCETDQAGTPARHLHDQQTPPRCQSDVECRLWGRGSLCLGWSEWRCSVPAGCIGLHPDHSANQIPAHPIRTRKQ